MPKELQQLDITKITLICSYLDTFLLEVLEFQFVSASDQIAFIFFLCMCCCVHILYWQEELCDER